MTYAEIAEKIDFIINKTGFDFPVNYNDLIREAENEFIKLSKCCDDFKITATSGLNGGTLDGVYDISDLINTDAGFIEEIRVGYGGRPLEKIHQNTIGKLYDSDGDLREGSPFGFWIEREKLRLFPKPSDHANIYLWYIKSNEDDDGASPIIPSAEHIYLREYVIALLLDASEKVSDNKRAAEFWSRFYANANMAKLKYWKQRFKQRRIIDVTNFSRYASRVATNAMGGQVVSSEDSTIYVWNKVALSDTVNEQTLIVGSGELTLANLDSGQTSIPVFSGDVAVDLSSGYQDRTAYISTEPSISNGIITFGVTLSTAGASGTPYFDIIVRQL